MRSLDTAEVAAPSLLDGRAGRPKRDAYINRAEAVRPCLRALFSPPPQGYTQRPGRNLWVRQLPGVA
jgi:hypothetical protein